MGQLKGENEMTTRIHKITKVAYTIINWPLFGKYATVTAVGRLSNKKEYKILKSELKEG